MDLANTIAKFVGGLPQTQQQVSDATNTLTAGADELKMAIKAQLVMQALMVLGTAYLCYVAFKNDRRH